MSKSFQLVISPDLAGRRIDICLNLMLPEYSRTYWQTRIREGDVRVAEKTVTAHQKMRTGEIIDVVVPDMLIPHAGPEQIPIIVMYEDAEILIINKQRGLTVHPCPSVPNKTLVNALKGRNVPLSSTGGELRPGIVHRLDKVTSGLLVIAKNDWAHRSLWRQFKSRVVEKRYAALVVGKIPQLPCTIDAPIGRHPIQRHKMTILPSTGRESKTILLGAKTYGDVSLLDIKICTGRTHQIRIHLRSIGLAVLNDQMYGFRHVDYVRHQRVCHACDQLSGIALHSYYLSFLHPVLKRRISFKAPLPRDMCRIIDIAQKYISC